MGQIRRKTSEDFPEMKMTRREFVKKAGLGVLGLGVSGYFLAKLLRRPAASAGSSGDVALGFGGET